MAKKPKWVLTDSFPTPLLRVVAQITVAAGQMDYVLLLAYKRASGKRMAVGMLEAEGFRGLKDLLKAIKKDFKARTSDAVANEELRQILTEVWNVYQERHTVVHAVFVKHEGELKRFYSDKPDIKIKAKNYGVEVEKPMPIIVPSFQSTYDRIERMSEGQDY
jgi:putative protein kinase ArgK-like GTPase of G3E family